MDSPIAPSAMRRAEDGPAYDLISLGLVVLTILLFGVWTSHFFREPASDDTDYKAVVAGLPHVENIPDPVPEDLSRILTSDGNLRAAQWADFNLRSPGGNEISSQFRDHLKSSLEQEEQERSFLVWRKTHGDEQSRIEASAILAEQDEEGGTPARVYARKWYEIRSAWLDSRDAEKVDVGAHLDFAQLLKDLGMKNEAAAEIEKVRRARPDWPGSLK